MDNAPEGDVGGGSKNSSALQPGRQGPVAQPGMHFTMQFDRLNQAL